MTKIVTKFGNLLQVTNGHIVHGCNAQGVMGSGVALAVKNKYPLAFKDYRQHYDGRGLVLGQAYPVAVSTDLVIWNAVTQNLYGTGIRQVSYDAIATCFEQVNADLLVSTAGTKEVHIPFIGAGLGGGSWPIISAIIEETMDYPVIVWSINGKGPSGESIEITA
jgi:O-acetyl-ADP-ribose deacetylase (regulator of RNase III)